MVDEQFEVNFDVIEESVCWRLLSRGGVGRIAFVYDGEPIILPVNFAVASETIVFRTGDETMLYEIGDGTLVAFEGDEIDDVAESGWDVLVRGHLWELTEEPPRVHLEDLALRPWAPGPRDRWMAIVPTQVSGRMITRHRRDVDAPRPSYMPPD